MPSSRTWTRGSAALAGLLSLGAALVAGQVTTLVHASFDSPVLYVANAVVEYAPAGVTAFAIEVFGQNDKLALLLGIGILLALFAAGLGVLAVRRRDVAVAGVVLLGATGALAGLGTGESALAALVPTTGTTAVGIAVLLLLARRVAAEPLPAGATGGHEQLDRRRFLRAAGVVAAAAAGAGALTRMVASGVDVAAQRAGLLLPQPARIADLPVTPAAHPDVAGLPPFITPTPEFYRIDTALVVPSVSAEDHQIRVTGMVEAELTIPFDRLLQRDMLKIPMNLVCVSNEVGGELVDAAVWQGVLLRDVLDEAGVAPDATEVVGRSVDGYTCGFPVEAAYDRPTMIAVGMNDEPLPAEHGFPARLVTPGLYGYVGSTKWLSEVTLTRFDAFDQYWATRGYADRAPIKISSRIEVPRPRATVPAGTVAVAGSAWAPVDGIARVEVQVDDGAWRDAQLGAAVNDLTWRQWVYRWDASPGPHRLTVRATSASGRLQTQERSGVRPDGATGWHTVRVDIGQG